MGASAEAQALGLWVKYSGIWAISLPFSSVSNCSLYNGDFKYDSKDIIHLFTHDETTD